MSINRITGITSGMDTDSMIKDLMKIEKAKIDNTEKNKILVEWEQEGYREVINGMRAFQDEYFDLLNPENNLRSVSSFSEFNESVQVNGSDVTYLSVTGTPSISDYSHTIDSITRLATEDEWKTDAVGIGNLKSNEINFGISPMSLEFSLTIDGNTKSISIPDMTGITDKTLLATALDAEIQNQFGSDYAGVVQADATSESIYFRLDGSNITILETTDKEAELDWMGYTSGQSTNSYASESLFGLLGITNADLESMTINDVTLSEIGITQGSSLSELTNILSANTDINVDFSYSSTSDSFFC